MEVSGVVRTEERLAFSRWWVIGIVMAGAFMAVLDANIVNVALPHMMATFSTDIDRIKWVVTAYSLAFALSTILSHWLSEAVGEKTVYMVSTATFTAASMLCGLSWNLEAMVAFRILQGSAAGFMMPTAMAILTETFPPEERGKAFGIFGIVIVFAPTIGPTLGGYLSDEVHWRYIFYVNLLPGILVPLASWVVLDSVPRRMSPRFDYLGFGGLSLCLSGLLLALSEGQREGWTSDFVLLCLFAGFWGGAVFLLAALWSKKSLLDLTLFANVAFSLLIVLAFLRSVGLFGRIFLLPVFMQRLMGYSAVDTGWLLAPGALVAGVTMPVVGRLFDAVGRPRLFLVPGFALLGLSQYLYYDLTAITEYSDILWPQVLFGFAMGMLQAPVMTTAMNVVRRDQIGMVSSLQSVVMQLGASFGVAFVGTMVDRRQVFHLAHYSEQAGLSHLLPQQIPPFLRVTTIRKEALVAAFDDVFVLMAAVCLLGMALSLFLRIGRRP